MKLIKYFLQRRSVTILLLVLVLAGGLFSYVKMGKLEEGIFLVQKISAMHQVSAAMRIPMVIPYASAPVGGLLMSVRLVQKIIETLKKLGDDKNYETKEAA